MQIFQINLLLTCWIVLKIIQYMLSVLHSQCNLPADAQATLRASASTAMVLTKKQNIPVSSIKRVNIP